MDDPGPSTPLLSSPSPVNESSLQVVKTKQHLASRIFHALLAVAFFILLLLALVSVSTFAAINNDVRENSIYGRKDSKGLVGDYGTCMLYGHHACTLKYKSGSTVRDQFCPSSGSTCGAFIGGQAIVVIVAAVLCSTSIIKVFAGFRM